MPDATRWAAMSSCVDSGLDAHKLRSAPPAFNVCARLAVSAVIWRQPEILIPFKGFYCLNLVLISLRTGISLSAHSALNAPLGAKLISFMS